MACDRCCASKLEGPSLPSLCVVLVLALVLVSLVLVSLALALVMDALQPE